jgi:hypothetical protein
MSVVLCLLGIVGLFGGANAGKNISKEDLDTFNRAARDEWDWHSGDHHRH